MHCESCFCFCVSLRPFFRLSSLQWATQTVAVLWDLLCCFVCSGNLGEQEGWVWYDLIHAWGNGGLLLFFGVCFRAYFMPYTYYGTVLSVPNYVFWGFSATWVFLVLVILSFNHLVVVSQSTQTLFLCAHCKSCSLPAHVSLHAHAHICWHVPLIQCLQYTALN